MPGGLRDQRWRTLAVFGVAIYAAFLVAAPFAHHDLVCPIKTPFHGGSCACSPVGSDLQPAPLFGYWSLSCAGRVCGDRLLTDGILLPVCLTGRSPPAAA